MQFNLSRDNGFFEIKISGKAEVEIYKDFIDALIAHQDWAPDSIVLIDETELDTSPLNTESLKQIAIICETHRAKLGAVKCALLAPRNLQYGMARMWAAYVENNWDVEARVFKKRGEAIDWLTT